ncbi:MAG: class I SAM-dependent methyltransferase [Burkholderiales bacterium]|nr:class I SAM-dependent methyltransferase [Burkholderiales bacterium]
MSNQIIDLQDWLQTPVGRYLLAWERIQVDEAVADIFGYHALQLGVPELDGLQANRMPHQWLATETLTHGDGVPGRPSLLCDFTALPFPAASLDLVVLPHTLEFSIDPHATLREVERVLVPEGRVVICGLNPMSLWGLRQRRARLYQKMGVGNLFLPDAGEFIGYWRLRDWLRLLGFEVEVADFGCYRPGVNSEAWLQRFEWMDRAGPRWWPILGAAYFIVAVKRVRGMRLLEPGWKAASVRVRKSVPLANRTHNNRLDAKIETE